jgi:hypothetical protein
MQAMKWMQDLAKAGDVGARLDKVKIGSCMNAWFNARSYRHAADFLDSTCNERIAGNDTIVPNYPYFNKTIRGLCSVNNVARADDLVRLIWKLLFNKVPFASDTIALVRFVISEWIRMDRPDRAEDLLFQMEAHSCSGKIKEYPDVYSYQLVIAAWKKSQFHDKNEHIRNLQKHQETLKKYVKSSHYFRKSG